mgnify:CR=1 FL=1
MSLSGMFCAPANLAIPHSFVATFPPASLPGFLPAVLPVPQEDRAQAEEMGLELELVADPEGGKESLKTAMKTIIKASPFDRAMKVEAELNKLNGRIIKLLDSMRAHEADQSRLALERLKYQLARQKATGEFDIDPEDGADIEEDPEDAEPGGAE